MTDVDLHQGEVLSALEAILMVAEEPVPLADLADSLEIPGDQVERALRALQDEYSGLDPDAGPRVRGFELRRIAGGWRIYSRAGWAPIVGRYVVGADSAQLSQAALETLAIVAYRQPVTRNQVSLIRGVSVDSVMRSLQARGLIEESGSTPTGAYQYQTTQYFLACMGFETLDQLVPLAPFLPPAAEVEAMTIEPEE